MAEIQRENQIAESGVSHAVLRQLCDLVSFLIIQGIGSYDMGANECFNSFEWDDLWAIVPCLIMCSQSSFVWSQVCSVSFVLFSSAK